MNDNTRVVVFCYQGDSDLVLRHLPVHQAHRCPITVMSPADSPVFLQAPELDCHHVGKRAYIGQDSIDRHRSSLSTLFLEYPEEYFFLHDADSLCLSPELPAQLYNAASQGILYANEVLDPRPHETPYRKVALQPPYFLSRGILSRILKSPPLAIHPVTPYIDWWWTAHCWSAGVGSLPFSHLERPPKIAWAGGDPWEWREHMIRECGCVMQHPIKTAEHLQRMQRAYELRRH